MESESVEMKEESGVDAIVPGDLYSTKSESSASDVNGEEDTTSGYKSDHVCELCHRVFTTKREFVLHQYNHKEKCSYYCAYCFKTFPSEFTFKRHNKFHEKKKARCISCRICDKEFEYVKDLEEHHRQSHLNEKLFRCEHCQATFSWRENLNKHMRMHDGPASKPDHKCSKCGRLFMDNISLRLHMCDSNKKPEETKPDKPFVCKVCNKAFKFDFSYEAHMNSHEGPVAMNAFKKIYLKTLEEKKKKVQEAAVKKLQTKDLTPATVVKRDSKSDEAVQSQELVSDDQSVPPNSDIQNTSNLREIVLEIVNVSELPKPTATEGVQILAEGSDDITATVPLKDLITPPTSLKDNGLGNERVTDIESQNVQDSPKEELAAKGAPGDTVEGGGVSNSQNYQESVSDSTEEKENINGNPDKTAVVNDESNVSAKEKVDSKDVVPTNLFSGVAATPETSESTKSSGKKRSKRPLLYDYVMTEEKPFQCPECKMEFRWEISLTIHLQEHLGGAPATRNSRNRSIKKKLPSGPVSSKIVYRRASSDEEDDYHDTDFQYEEFTVNRVEKRKRGRPRKCPVDVSSESTVKRRRGRPPKDPYSRTTNSNETVVIRVTRGSGKNQSLPSSTNKPAPPLQETNSKNEVHCNVHIPKHRLIRFYLLRQLKLSRNRGFFPCRFCSIPFSCKASLNMHILRHTGKGSYQCSYCNQKFPDHRTLVLHRLIEEESAMKLPHQCSTCFRVCGSLQGLMRHLRRHLAIVWPSSRPRAKVTE